MSRSLPLTLAVVSILVLAGPRIAGVHAAETPSRSPTTVADQRDLQARLRLADWYARRGLVEEAVAEYLSVLARYPEQAGVREKVGDLVAREMPKRLPGEVERVRPFPLHAFTLWLADPESPGREKVHRVLVTEAGLPAGEGLRRGPLRKWEFPNIEYGYAWQPEDGMWVMKGRVHWSREEDRALARDALRCLLAVWCVGKEYLDRDPALPWGRPVDLWLAPGGCPGGRAMGRNIYLFATAQPRPAGEWWRELAHEYGHVSLPGIGGFTDTDDPWADGNLGELLFTKWLAASGRPPEWLPWSLEARGRGAAGGADRGCRRPGASGPPGGNGRGRAGLLPRPGAARGRGGRAAVPRPGAGAVPAKPRGGLRAGRKQAGRGVGDRRLDEVARCRLPTLP